EAPFRSATRRAPKQKLEAPACSFRVHVLFVGDDVLADIRWAKNEQISERKQNEGHCRNQTIRQKSGLGSIVRWAKENSQDDARAGQRNDRPGQMEHPGECVIPRRPIPRDGPAQDEATCKEKSRVTK